MPETVEPSRDASGSGLARNRHADGPWVLDETLAELGCEVGRGYLWSRPLRPEHAIDLLHSPHLVAPDAHPRTVR